MHFPLINGKRLNDRLNAMSQIGALPEGGVKRLALTSEDKSARDLLTTWMKALGLVIQVDEMGNMFGILEGKNPNRWIGAGSHLDSVPTGGRYDGPLGVLAALEAAETIIENKIQLNHSLVIANYTNEEGVRFFPDMMGSLAHANPEKVSTLWQSMDSEGTTVREALQRIDYLGSEKCGSIPYDFFVELHIEQGPILEDGNNDIGVVKNVQAIHWCRLTIEGKSGHAGTKPIHARKDALHALGRLSTYARQLCHELEHQLITIGSVEVFPNAINVIPEKVIATLDIRSPYDENISKALIKLEEFMSSDDSFVSLSVNNETLVNIPAVEFNPNVTKAIEESCRTLGLSYQYMHSGAGHDAQILGRRYPAAMIFIPSKDGVSHAVDEYSSPKQIEKGANVLLLTLLKLDQV